jgi:hypothetical protein
LQQGILSANSPWASAARDGPLAGEPILHQFRPGDYGRELADRIHCDRNADLEYRDERAAAGERTGPDDPANFVLMTLVGLSELGLPIRPTHRLVSGSPDLNGDRLAAAGRRRVARLRCDATPDRFVPDHGPGWCAPGVGNLHDLELESLPADRGMVLFPSVPRVDRFRPDVADRGCNPACLIPAAGMGPIAAIASNPEEMPPGRTLFDPDLLLGLVLNPLRRGITRARGGRGT